jgi:hypothetical protein
MSTGLILLAIFIVMSTLVVVATLITVALVRWRRNREAITARRRTTLGRHR